MIETTAANMAPPAEERAGQVRALVRALRILNTLATRPEGLSLTEIARTTDLSPATAHRLLTTLEQEHYVRFEQGARRWAVGLQAYLAGAVYADSRGLRRLAAPHMRALLDVSHETVNLAVEEHGTLVYLHQIGERGSGLAASVPLPLHGSGVGKAMLSAQADGVLAGLLPTLRLTPLTAKTVADRRRLHDQILEARGQGYAVDDEEHVPGMRCVAAAVLGRRGRPVAALSVSGPSERMPPERIAALGTLVREAANALTGKLA
ncbi:IclR family transcriptional regulator [Chelatococcus sp. SYSU_G07232]|uniref:IclR family transcriptional regulator n=1 Tax=Chelatococcus albus TaxID=3047466 RepID=A0ABT7ACG4_9HYPH|nr:IclR family transcriptional regulator [Chelatococcus sp. SYSU_G07232]MDJ1157065.1 IclR family transcriptional regulator [Chelatococcus sp. SYSU_G07232]